MEFLSTLVILFFVHVASAMAPGPDMALSIRNSIVYGRSVGIACAFGFTAGIAVHIALVLSGVAWLITEYDVAYNTVRFGGAAYLIYMGVACLRSSAGAFKRRRGRVAGESGEAQAALTAEINRPKAVEDKSLHSAFIQGFVTNLMNPKAIMYFISVFTQFIKPSTVLWQKVAMGGVCVSIQIVWFSFVAIVLSHPVFQKRFMAITHWIDGVFGVMIVALGVKLAVG